MEPDILLTPFEEMDLRIIRAKLDAIMKLTPDTRIKYNEIICTLSEKEMDIMERGAQRHKQKIDSSHQTIYNIHNIQ